MENVVNLWYMDGKKVSDFYYCRAKYCWNLNQLVVNQMGNISKVNEQFLEESIK
jgi:hypothetical protein